MHCIASNGSREKWIWRDVEEDGHNPLNDTVPEFASRNWGIPRKNSVSIASFRTEKQTGMRSRRTDHSSATFGVSGAKLSMTKFWNFKRIESTSLFYSDWKKRQLETGRRCSGLCADFVTGTGVMPKPIYRWNGVYIAILMLSNSIKSEPK